MEKTKKIYVTAEETAEMLGMKAVQAVQYLKENTSQPSKRKPGFKQLETPLDILNII